MMQTNCFIRFKMFTIVAFKRDGSVFPQWSEMEDPKGRESHAEVATFLPDR